MPLPTPKKGYQRKLDPEKEWPPLPRKAAEDPEMVDWYYRLKRVLNRQFEAFADELDRLDKGQSS